MASRTFTDERGVEWVLLAVSPTWSERRVKKDRRIQDIGPKPGQPDRRKGADRRSGRPERWRRTKIDPSLAGGWLVFEGAGERRRLSPATPEWSHRVATAGVTGGRSPPLDCLVVWVSASPASARAGAASTRFGAETGYLMHRSS
jgi:hypothetical protein